MKCNTVYGCLTPHLCRKVRKCVQGPSERATSKPAGPAKVVAAVATCSLPVLSVQAAIERLNEASDIAEKAGAFLYAATFRGVALNLRAEMALSKSRQPEENAEISHDRERKTKI